MKVYIAGKITGDPKYRKKFKEAATDISRGATSLSTQPTCQKGCAQKTTCASVLR